MGDRVYFVLDEHSDMVHLSSLQQWPDVVDNSSYVLVKFGVGTDVHWHIVLASPLEQPCRQQNITYI